ncbi:DEAD/DEAH box helicase [Xylophilus sp.]|uniref:DEAD/DEAH box helicase n=1 Tax=Xylophilus sp. TaxID=2653893 RepID=UPI0013BD88D0|nr:DEAD/DEAH box helicase [Xylophilus sp.]KAF1045650.1 MAG: putative DNA repair helicase RadD [Xylophilus sp.]
MKLRPYQQKALTACWDFLRNREGNPALVLPTGAGKSPLMAAIAMEAVQGWGGRVGILAPRQELVEQNSEKLKALWPEAPVGIYAAGLRRRDRFNKILYMQIQSVAKRAHQLGRFDLLVVDEGQDIPLGGDGMYLTFIRECQKFNANLRVIVLTATPYRLQGKAVPICGPNYVVNDIAYEARVGDLIHDGYLSQLVSQGGQLPDLSTVRLRGGEYVEGELAGAMLPLVRSTVADLLARTTGRRCGIAFCVNVEHALAVRDALLAHGETVCIVHQGSAGRDDAFSGHRSGKYSWMVNVNVAAVGYDNPIIDVVAMLRPTKSPGMYYQQVGRGFRPVYASGYDLEELSERLAALASGGKPNCLVLDYAGNMLEHGPVDAIRVRAARPRKAAHVERGTSKECPKCRELVPMQARICPGRDAQGNQCTQVWGSLDPAHSDRPVDAPVLSHCRERAIHVHPVNSVAYARHEKGGKTPSLKVTYQCGMRRFNEWVCIEHAGMPRAKALRWWQARSAEQCPRTIEEALPLAWQLPRPLFITVDETDKYPEILAHEFAEAEREPAPASDRGDAQRLDGNGVTTGADAVPGVRRVPGWLVSAVEANRTGKRAA